MPGFKPQLTLAITVSDLKKAADFYTSVLGCQELYMLPEVGWGEVTSPVEGVTIGLGIPQEGESIVRDGGATITFGVEDIDAVRTELESKGVQFDAPTYEVPGMVRLANFRDPDGNALMLAQTLQEMG